MVYFVINSIIYLAKYVNTYYNKGMEKDCELVLAHPKEGDRLHKFCSKDLAQAVWYGLEHQGQVAAIRTPLGTLTLIDNETYDLLRGRKDTKSVDKLNQGE